MMKVMMITESLEFGGAETLAIALAGAIARMPNRRVSFAAHEGPLLQRLDPRVRYFPVPVYSPFEAAAFVRRLARILGDERPDVIHAQGATVGTLAVLTAKTVGLRAASVLTHHSATTRRLSPAIASWILNRCFDRFIAISRSKHEQLLSGGIPAEKLSCIPNFVDCDAIGRRLAEIDRNAVRAEIALAPGQKAVIVAGRLVRKKRMDRFIEILARYGRGARERPVGLILGDGPERPRLERLAKVLARDARVIFLGYQPDIYKYLAVSSAFLFPSAHPEVLPMALIEALAAGVPAVCSDIPGNNEIIEHGRTGYLVRGGDEEYSERLGDLLADDAHRAAMAAGARAAARRLYHEPVVAGRIAALYDSMAIRRRHDGHEAARNGL